MGSTDRRPRAPGSCEREAELDALVFFTQAMKLIEADHPGAREVADLRRRAYLTAMSEIAKERLRIERGEDSPLDRRECEERRATGCAACSLKSPRHTIEVIRARFGAEALGILKRYGRRDGNGN